ncbi:MAG: nuclear transport factor 2 family protein [Fimbriimonadaceae bacterium]|nr:nuclear transport factor 2 family protein [Fimbriimonadaceae bacterium]
MRNNKIRWGAGFVLGTASVAVAWGDVREDLTIRYGIWDTAYRKHDVLTLASLLHSKFVLFTDTGKAITRASYIASLWRSSPPPVYGTTLLTATRDGNRAVATTREQSGTDGDLHHHEYRDTWILRKGHWQLIESRTAKHD